MDMDSVLKLIDDVQIPQMATVKQKFNDACLGDCKETLLRGLEEKQIGKLIKPGMRIAITGGSRGIANMSLLLRALGEYIRARGGEPFLFPAMGSHGGATARGQTMVLEKYGMAEEVTGLPIKSSMDVVKIGEMEDGLPIYVDKNAYEADGVIAINRIKLHTGFRAKYESGVMKIMAVGMGKQKGADLYHSKGLNEIPVNVEKAATIIMEKMNIVCGVGLMENAFDETFEIAVMKKEEIPIIEADCLKKAAARMACIKFDNLDVLVVDKIGKNYSGGGMDSNITKRFINPNMAGLPLTKMIAVLDLSEETDGNSNGMGLSDVVTERLVKKIDYEAIYMNSITSGVTESPKVPMTMPNDSYALKAAIKLSKITDPKKVRMVRISNTMKLDRIQISEALLKEALGRDDIEVVTELKEPEFNHMGNLF